MVAFTSKTTYYSPSSLLVYLRIQELKLKTHTACGLDFPHQASWKVRDGSELAAKASNYVAGSGVNVSFWSHMKFFTNMKLARQARFCRYSRGYSDEKHVHGPEEDVGAVAQPDVGQCVHDEDAGGHEQGEDAQRQLPPHGPAHWDVSHDQRCQSPCGRARCKEEDQSVLLRPEVQLSRINIRRLLKRKLTGPTALSVSSNSAPPKPFSKAAHAKMLLVMTLLEERLVLCQFCFFHTLKRKEEKLFTKHFLHQV